MMKISMPGSGLHGKAQSLRLPTLLSTCCRMLETLFHYYSILLASCLFMWFFHMGGSHWVIEKKPVDCSLIYYSSVLVLCRKVSLKLDAVFLLETQLFHCIQWYFGLGEGKGLVNLLICLAVSSKIFPSPTMTASPLPAIVWGYKD